MTEFKRHTSLARKRSVPTEVGRIRLLFLDHNFLPPHNHTLSSHFRPLPNQPQSPTHTTINMSAPNADKPNEGIVGQIGNSIQNAANYVSETVQGKSSEASKEANKQQAKGNTPNDSISDRISGAAGAVGDKFDQTKHETSAKANKESI